MSLLRQIPKRALGEGEAVSSLRNTLSEYDPLHLIASCGALALKPENASRLFRVEAMAHIAATFRDPKSSHITPTILEQLFAAPPLNSVIKDAEDPFPNIFVEEVPFHGGGYRVLPGPTAGTSFSFQCLTKCLFQNENEWPLDFIARAYQLVRAVLSLSELLLHRAGLKRGTLGDSTEQGVVRIPDAADFDRLRRAVVFSDEEINTHLRRISIDLEEIAELIMPMGSFEVADHSVSNGPLIHRPIVRQGETLIVAAPQRLVAATTHILLCRIDSAGLQQTYARLYPESVKASAARALRYLRHALIRFVPSTPADLEGISEAFYRFDTDKFLYLLVVCDTLKDFNAEVKDDIWGLEAFANSLAARTKAVSEELLSKAGVGAKLLCLLLPSSASRMHELSASGWPDNIQVVALTPHNLETIAHIEAGNPMTLWNFALRTAVALKKYRLIYFDELDLFAAYRDMNYSYDLGDREPPEGILVKPAYGSKLKAKLARQYDWHAVPFFEKNRVVVVNTLYGDQSVPLYASPDMTFPSVCVEQLPCLFWVYPSHAIGESEHSLYFEFVSAVAYWIWQLSSFLQTLCPNLEHRDMMHVRLALSAEFISDTNIAADDDGPGVIAAVTDPGIVVLKLQQRFRTWLRSTDNIAEREMLRALIPGIAQASGAPNELSELMVDKVIEMVAPLGLKRMLMHSDLRYVPELDLRDLPDHRQIQPGNIEQVLDELSQYLTAKHQLKAGVIDPATCNGVLKDAVTFCFTRIAEIVRDLKPEGLLEGLVTLNEALIRESAFRQLTVATRRETFENNQEVLLGIARDLPEFAQAGVAARFIIEFVAAQPPRGRQSMSLEVYDHLQALAATLIQWGSASDTLYFGLTESQMYVSRSGRIRIMNSTYSAVLSSVLGDLAMTRFRDSDAVFHYHMREREPNRAAVDDENALHRATRAEFGHSLSELVDFLIALGDIAMDLRPSTPAVMEGQALIATLERELSWSRQKIESCLAIFSISPREVYLYPPRGCRQEDLYPWRFNREASYLRCPLLVRERRGATEYVWGHRHLETARAYLVQLCSSTRLRAKSEPMKSLLAQFRHEAGKRFNNEVYDALKRFPQLRVEKQVTKIGHLQTNELGDIDILCAESEKKLLWVIECKSLAMARTPYEMKAHLEALTASTSGRSSVIRKHENRTAWVYNHRRDVLKWMGINDDPSWTVHPLIVTDVLSVSPILRNVSIQIISIDMLKGLVGKR